MLFKCFPSMIEYSVESDRLKMYHFTRSSERGIILSHADEFLLFGTIDISETIGQFNDQPS